MQFLHIALRSCPEFPDYSTTPSIPLVSRWKGLISPLLSIRGAGGVTDRVLHISPLLQ